MAKGLIETVAEIRECIEKDKLKAARKVLEKAEKAGIKGPPLTEVTVQLLLAEGGGAPAAAGLRDAARSAESRLPALLKHAEMHLRRRADDHEVRDVVWELLLAQEQPEPALQHLSTLLQAGAIQPAARAQALLERKDIVGATGIFLLASLGAVKTDRMRLADRLLQGESGQRLLGSLVNGLRAAGREDAATHYVVAQIARKQGDQEAFLASTAKALEEQPDEIWTWTQGALESDQRLELAARTGKIDYVLQAAADSPPQLLPAVAGRISGDSVAVRAITGLALLIKEKVSNGCRILEEVIRREPAAGPGLADLLRAKEAAWPGAREAFASAVVEGLSGDPERISQAVDLLLRVPEGSRGEAWSRVAPRLLRLAESRSELRDAMGRLHLAAGEDAEAAALLQAPDHLPLARGWAETGKAGPVVVRAAADLVERHGLIAENAEWLLKAARIDAALLADIGRRLSGSAVSASTALRSATALLDQGQKPEAAAFLSRLTLDRETGEQVERLLRERNLRDDRAFVTPSFRCALSLGEAPRARQLFKSVNLNMQQLAKEAEAFSDPARVLADVLIEQGKGEVAVGLIEARRAAGDQPRVLLPLADALFRAAPRLSAGRLVRARILQALRRDDDAVRDLRAIPFDAAELEEAFRLLGELTKGDARAPASLGRIDIHLARKSWPSAVQELGTSEAPPAERLQRYETVCRERSDMDAAHRGRARCLMELGRVPDSAEAHFRRFACSDADPAAVATDLEEVAQATLKAGDLATTSSVLERLPEQVSDGAERAIRVIGEDKRPTMLILRSKMLLLLGRTEQAVSALSDLVRVDPASRPQAARALEEIIAGGQARPEADFALATAYDAMGQTPRALATLTRLYGDDLTSRENVARAAEQLVRRADDPDVRLFLARVCLDMRDAAGATEHCIYARRLRPAARREVVDLLRKGLDLDAFAPDTHFALAEAHLAGDEADDAVRHFRAAVEVDRARAAAAIRAMEEAAPRSTQPSLLWLAVGTTYAEFLKDHTKAVEAFTNGLNSTPRTEMKVPLLLGRGDSYAALHRDDEAFDDFDEASRHDLLERRYYEYLRSRHRRRELEAAERARGQASTNLAAAAEACARFIRIGRPDEAVAVAQTVLAANANDVGARYLVGVSLHAAARYDAAARALEAVREKAAADTEVGRSARMLLAESYLDKGDRESARACLTEIEAVDAAYPGLSGRRAALAPPADDPHAPLPLFVRPDFPRPTE